VWGIVATLSAAAVAGLMLLVVPAGDAAAAVRVCKAPVSSALASEPTEQASRRRAIVSWTERARASGVANASWSIAANKLLRCARVGAKFDCLALAAPCAVSQSPPSPGGPKRGRKLKSPERAISV